MTIFWMSDTTIRFRSGFRGHSASLPHVHGDVSSRRNEPQLLMKTESDTAWEIWVNINLLTLNCREEEGGGNCTVTINQSDGACGGWVSSSSFATARPPSSWWFHVNGVMITSGDGFQFSPAAPAVLRGGEGKKRRGLITVAENNRSECFTEWDFWKDPRGFLKISALFGNVMEADPGAACFIWR